MKPPKYSPIRFLNLSGHILSREAHNAGLQLRRAISIQAEGKGYLRNTLLRIRVFLAELHAGGYLPGEVADFDPLPNNAESVRQFQPRVCFETLGFKSRKNYSQL
jgi:hypothetical protein